jgi:hypothetical protein
LTANSTSGGCHGNAIASEAQTIDPAGAKIRSQEDDEASEKLG